MEHRLNNLIDAISANESRPHYGKRRVTLLVGNDREIGKETGSPERRVGVTPEQVGQLRKFTKSAGFDLDVLVMQNAGAHARFADHDFVRSGAEIVTEDKLPHLDTAPDVVHALKEPSRYESRVTPGSFCRIGALHSGDFHEGAGIAGLLARRNVTVFDGSNIGASGAFRIPVRGRMSVFAGEIAAEWVLDHLKREDLTGRCVVVGGGYVGRASTRELLSDPRTQEVVLLDNLEVPGRVAELRKIFADTDRVSVGGIDDEDHPALLDAVSGAVAVVLGVARAGKQAPKVVTVTSLRERLHETAMVVDVSIDERGAIRNDEIEADWSLAQIIREMEDVFRPRRYRAISNMPRAYPYKASKAHGEAVLPYLATLLYLCAREGGPESVTRLFAEMPADTKSPDPWEGEPDTLLDRLVQDLRNGLAFHPAGDGIVIEPIVADVRGVTTFLKSRGIACQTPGR